MRTTLVIDDGLLAEAKRAAAERQCSLSEVVNEALRSALAPVRRLAEAPPFRIPRFCGEGETTDTTPPELAELDGGNEPERYRS